MKKQILILFFCMSVIATCKNPAAPQLEAKFGGTLTFEKRFQPTSDPIAGVSGLTVTRDGGYAMIGYSGTVQTFDSTNDFLKRSGLFVKTTALGLPRLVKNYNALSCSFLVLTAFEQTSDEGFIAVGYTNNPFHLDAQVGMYLLKTNVRGEQEWVKRLEQPYVRRIPRSIHQTNDGGYIIAGDKNVSADANDDIMVMKTDAMGNMQWETVIDGGYHDFPDHGYAVRQTKDGGYIVAGSIGTCFHYQANASDGSPFNYFDRYIYIGQNAALIKLNASGNVQWKQLYPNSNQSPSFYAIPPPTNRPIITEISAAFDVLQTGNWDYVLTGYATPLTYELAFASSANDNVIYKTHLDSLRVLAEFGSATRISNSPSQMFFIRTNNVGGMNFKQVYASDNSEGHTIARTSDGGFVMNGVTNKLLSGYMYAVKADSLGVASWTRQYGQSGIEESGCGVQQTIDGGYILAGTAYPGSIHLVKIDSLGKLSTTRPQ